MENIMKITYPSYFNEFECIGGVCEDSCCIGWDIDIDKPTFKEYFKVKDEEMKKMFQKNVQNNEEYTSSDIDYGKVKLRNDKRCPFLDDNNYCIIYSKLGEEYLSNICTHFPRILNKVDNLYEISLDVACPEAARIILGKEDGLEFNTSEEILKKYIVSGEFNTNSKKFKNSAIKYFKEIRDLSIKIMKNRRFDLSTRLYVLGDLLGRLEEETEFDCDIVPKFIKSYNIDCVASSYEKNNLNYILQVSFFKNIVDSSHILDKVISVPFKMHTKELLKGFNIGDFNEKSEEYINAFEDYIRKYISANSYIFENYIINFIYNNMFPFSESDSMFEGYIMLLTRYSFIRFYLVGKYIYNKKDSKEDIIKFIQVFSKALEHDNNYFTEVLEYIKENEFDNVEFAKTLL